MKLYMLRGCPFAHRAVMALREKKLDFDIVFYDREKRPAELDAIGARAKSPTLFDGERAVHESLVVLEYLEDRYPEPALLPQDPLERARVRMFQTRVSEELMPKHGALVAELLFKREPDPHKVDELRRAFVESLQAWDRHFQGRTFACSDAFSLADITLYTIFPSTKAVAGVEIPGEYSHLRAWLDRVAARPSAAVPQP